MFPGGHPAFPRGHQALPRRHLSSRAVILEMQAVGRRKRPASSVRSGPSKFGSPSPLTGRKAGEDAGGPRGTCPDGAGLPLAQEPLQQSMEVVSPLLARRGVAPPVVEAGAHAPLNALDHRLVLALHAVEGGAGAAVEAG